MKQQQQTLTSNSLPDNIPVKQVTAAANSKTTKHATTSSRGNNSETDSNAAYTISRHIANAIAQSFPKSSADRAKRLFLYLMNFGNGVFSVDEIGTLWIHGREMDASVVDYIYCTLNNVSQQEQQQQLQRPGDFHYFQRALVEIRVPAHLLQGSGKPVQSLDAVSVPKSSRKQSWLSY
jgi:hypothetical protein